MKSLFETENQQSILNRIQNLNEISQPNWGKMDVAQMLTHCQKPLEVANGTLQLNTKIGFAKKLLFKLFKSTMYNNKPWQKNLSTVREFRITDAQDFTSQKEKLIHVINEFSQLKEKKCWPTHPLFGDFTTKQWGKMQYKHLDHHLTQFGV
ncbi:DUF1569 domain-containing protein [Sabulilitoribacter arenilitoris]|uniref:DUF1569 domain-containing protein n=1 Tax=Wocania arenilitoris TaxID=2044858 RepID=A0AAE3ESX3_9FLAO|nr:DUF1569 domain-containing protein [Wocania arenilitoris]MCF7569550.1 DUF1569 domain-containing protein [Wocania arenilitoris]